MPMAPLVRARIIGSSGRLEMIVSIGSDHGGLSQKDSLAERLRDKGEEVIDRGTDSDASVDYPDYAEAVALDVAKGRADIGILVCGTGIGMAIAANKVDGIRAANVTSVEFARLAREHNDANVLALSGRFVPLEENERIVDAFVSTPFGGGRHERRVGKVMALEGRES